MFLDLASHMKSMYSTLELYLHRTGRTFPSSVSVLNSFANEPFFKSGDRYGFFFTVKHIFFWFSEEKKELSPSQILYNKFEKYLSLSIYRNICFIQIKFCFSMENNCSIIYLRSRVVVWIGASQDTLPNLKKKYSPICLYTHFNFFLSKFNYRNYKKTNKTDI